MASRFTDGSIRRYRKAWKEDGRQHERWLWQIVVVEYDEQGKKHIHAKVTDIECSPATDRVKGKKQSAAGKGATKATEALKQYHDQLIAEDRKREQEKAEAAAAAKRAAQEAADPASEIVGTYIDKYIEREEAARHIEASTARAYQCSNRYVRMYWPDVRWRDVTPKMVRDLEKALAEEQDLSSSTIIKVHRLIYLVSRELLNDDLLEKDPMRGVKQPKRVIKNPNAYSAADLPYILGQLETLPDSPAVIAAYLALNAGLRVGEIAALQWKNVDLSANRITVESSIGVGRGTTYIKSTKSDKIRNVPMTAVLRSRLARLRVSQTEEHLRLGLGPDISENYVTGSIDGSYTHPSVLSRSWRQLSNVLGIKGTEGRFPTFHDLRHTYATTSLAAGVDVKTLSSEMGHVDAAVTLNTYASADPKAKQAAAKALDEVMQPRKAQVMQLGRTGTDGQQ
ncbi:MAG: site-specific integrase [Olsenella sp.]|jgi:integrase